MGSDNAKWKLVTNYGVKAYKCGLNAGDQVELPKPLAIRDHDGVPTGKVHRAGEVWTVLSGSREDPGVVWFRRPDGGRHTWNDDAGDIDEWFRRIDPEPTSSPQPN